MAEYEGTLVPYEDFNSEEDAKTLREAMKGLGTDEQAILSILGARAAWQRAEIVQMFKTMFGEDLIEELKSELGSNFEKICVALCTPAADFDAMCIHNAIKGAGTDEECLIEILCTRTNDEVSAINEAYKRLFEQTLEQDVMDDTSGDFKRLLVSLLQANRDESEEIDHGQADQDANELYEGGEDKLGTDESTFNAILVARSYPHLREVFQVYNAVAGKDIEDSINNELSGSLQDGMLTIVRCVKDRPAAFAHALYKSMKGLGTDDDSLIRLIVSRAEIDMVQIKDAFLSNYEKSLASFISDDVGGDYEKILLQLIGEPKADD